ncbi:bifunctional oligoribonuclease/PAP phosphatase NrnA [Chitinispirillales bacterium ANBcel5]|uniref:DHH family phosphoesterase n=1 Tax=Cellulosispirillum alkaliphilum TaxID=3039283 RepID=UPI002A5930BD|nr:bifunctional oligoribonuclease/PAP phosphatase NrnA [Chitinispirillales bacterium ANBcel5]
MTWNKLNETIERNSTFLISSHLSLDGDCVGSQLAFYWYLNSIGKTVKMYCSDPVPSKFLFLQNSRLIEDHKPDDSFDVLMILDCSNPARTGWQGQEKIADTIINIDHHRDNTHFGAINHVNVNAAATGEIIYDFFKDNGIHYPPFVAQALYTAIMTDTGGFRFSNTSSRILRKCADISDQGADCSKIYELVYSSHSQQGLLLQSKIWSTLSFHLEGKVCSMNMPLKAIEETGALYSDSEGMSDYTITAKGVEVGMLCKHTPSETHFSLRSKGKIDVGRIAQKVPGGGGHSCAAGCTIKRPFKAALDYMLSILEQELD